MYIALYIALLYAPAFPLDPSKLFKLLYFDSFWIGESFGYISISILPDSQFGKRPVGPRYDHCKFQVNKNVLVYMVDGKGEVGSDCSCFFC